MSPELRPPVRPPKLTAPPAPERAPLTTRLGAEDIVPPPATSSEPSKPREQPIPPPSEPLQYRAIGLVEGRYLPSEEQFTRGTLRTPDGAELDAVLLGRVMNVVRKHLDSERAYLWVVYPRTREKEQTLHVQIMGVWAPGELGQDVDPEIQAAPDYFSIRGEVVFQSQEKGFIIVKIRQANKKTPSTKPQSFKLRLEGNLPGKGVGDFWNLEVRRQGSQLQIESGQDIATVPRAPARPRHLGKPQRKPQKPQRVGHSDTFSRPQPQDRFERPSRPEKPLKPIKKKPL